MQIRPSKEHFNRTYTDHGNRINRKNSVDYFRIKNLFYEKIQRNNCPFSEKIQRNNCPFSGKIQRNVLFFGLFSDSQIEICDIKLWKGGFRSAAFAKTEKQDTRSFQQSGAKVLQNS